MSAFDLRSVVYIDDDADLREVTALSLELMGGVAVHAFATGAEALAAQLPAPPDLLLVDVMMPGLDGPATLALLRREPRFADIPAIFFTAKARPEEVQSLLDKGAVGVLAKPFNPSTLADDLRRIVGGKVTP